MNSLEDRRTRGDLIQMFKIVNGFETVHLVNGVNYAKSLNLNLRRANNFRLVKEKTKISNRFQFLTNRIVPVWNSLSNESISAKSINSFKAFIDKEVFWKK